MEKFSGKVAELVVNNVPMRPRRVPSKPVWITREVTKAIRKKRRLWKKARGGQEEMDKYREAEKQAVKKIRNAKRNFEKKLEKEKNGNSRPFYAYLKGRTKSRPTIGPLKGGRGETVLEEVKMADILNEFFASVFTDEGKGLVPEKGTIDFALDLSDVKITVEKIKEKIRKLRPSSAPGPDKIGSGLLQQLQEEIAPILSIIFKKSLETGCIPEDWRTANVTSIFKKGAKSDPGNYRPVSLTLVGCKLFESLIRDDLMSHLLVNNLLKDSQHGFMSKKSCMTNLLEFFEIITRAVDEGEAVDAMFLDFAKAFDKVPRNEITEQTQSTWSEGKSAKMDSKLAGQ
jgi:hypothetical protein